MKINQVLDIYPLLEANIFNIKDEYEGVSIAGYLKQFVQNLPGVILQQQFTKKISHLLVNDERFHYAVRQLPAGAPEWAQKAVAAEQLYAFKPTTELTDTLSHITHYLAAAAEDSTKSPSPDQKVVAQRALLALPKAETIEVIKGHADEYFKRGSRKAERDVTGMEQVYDAGQGFIWYKLTAQDAYRREGKALQNCIGTVYTHARATKDKEVILILKNPSNESIVAMRVDDPKREMEEVKGKNNRPPVPKYMPPVVKFINHMKLKPSDGAMYDLKNAGYYYDKPSKNLYTKAEAIQHLVKTETLGKLPAGLTLVKATTANPQLFADLYGSMVGHGGYYGYSGFDSGKYSVYELRDGKNMPRATAIVTGTKLQSVASHQPQQNQPVAEAEKEVAKEAKPTSATLLLTSELMKRGIVKTLDKGIQRQMLWKDKVAWDEGKGEFSELSTVEPEVKTDKQHKSWKVYTDPAIIKQLYTSLQKAEESPYGDAAEFAKHYKLSSIDRIYVDNKTDIVDDDEDYDDEGDQSEVTYMILKTKDGILLPLRAVFNRGSASVLDKNAGFKGLNTWQRGERDQRTVASLAALANKQGMRLPKTFRINHGLVRKDDKYVQYEPTLEPVKSAMSASKISLTDLSYGDRLVAMSYLGSSKHTDQPEHERGDTLSVQQAITKAVGGTEPTDLTKWEKGELDKVYGKVFGTHTPETVYLVNISYGTDQKAKVALVVDKNTVVRVDGKTSGERWQKWADYDTVAAQLNKFADEQGLKFAPRSLLPLLSAEKKAEHSSELRISADGKVTTAAVEKKKSIEALRQKGRYAMEGTDELTFNDGVKMTRMDPETQATWVRQTMSGEGGRGEAWKMFDKAGKAQAIIIVDGKNLMSMYGLGYDKKDIRNRGLVMSMLPYVKQAMQTFGWVSKGRTFHMRQQGKMYDALEAFQSRGGDRRRQYLRDVEQQALGLGWLEKVQEARQFRSSLYRLTETGKAAVRRLRTGDLSFMDYVTAAELPKGFVAPKRRELPKPPPGAGTGKWKVSLAAPREGSKAESALAKFREMISPTGQLPSRGEFMQVMMRPPFNMSKFGAQTYYYTTKAKYAALGESFSDLAARELKNDPFMQSFKMFLIG